MRQRELELQRYIDDIHGRYAKPYTEALLELLVALAKRNKPAAADARARLARVISQTMGIGEVLGATMALQKAAGLLEDTGNRFRRDELYLVHFAATPPQAILPRVTFEEAVQDMVDRTPVALRLAAERTAQRVAELYSEAHVVAFVRASEQRVTEKVQSMIVEAMREGIPEAQIGHAIPLSVAEITEKAGAWTESYSRMVFRTNLGTATTAGRFRQALDPDVRAVIPALRYDAVMDSDTRPNHAAADGVIMRTDNQEWRRIAPPLGYNCRCTVTFIGRPELRRRGLLRADGGIQEIRPPSSAHPDPGFRHAGRPDLFMAGVA